MLYTGFTQAGCGEWGYSSLWCVCFSLQWLLWLWSTGCRCAGFRSYVAQAFLLQGVLNLPGPEIVPCPLHWQAGSYPRHHQGSTRYIHPLSVLPLLLDTRRAGSLLSGPSPGPLFVPHAPQLCVLESEPYGEPGRIPLSSGFQLGWPMGVTEETGGTRTGTWRNLFQALSTWSHAGPTAALHSASAPLAVLSLQAPSLHPFRLRMVTLPSVCGTGGRIILCCFS